MAMRPLVKIIKGGQRASGTAAAASTTQPRANEPSPRAIKTTVSSWVREFQQRSHVDAKLAFNNLFKEPLSHPSGT